METLERGFLINVFSERNCPGLLVSILETFEELGLNVLDARVSCSDSFHLEAVGGEVRKQTYVSFMSIHLSKTIHLTMYLHIDRGTYICMLTCMYMDFSQVLLLFSFGNFNFQIISFFTFELNQKGHQLYGHEIVLGPCARSFALWIEPHGFGLFNCER